MDGIEGVSGIPGGPGDRQPLAAAGAALPVASAVAGRASGMPASGPGGELAAAAEEPIRAGQFGGDGRFRKFILAVQALSLQISPREARTARIEAMRRAAEEIFSIDGVPELMRPGEAAEPPAASVAPDPGREPQQAPEIAGSPEAPPPESAGPAVRHSAAAADPPPD